MVIQRLEERRMLSVTLDEGTWVIETEDDRSHVISVDLNAARTKLQVTIDGKAAGSVAIADVDSVEIDCGGGNDKISFSVPNKDLWVDVYAGAGNDTIIGGGGDDDLSGEEGDDSVLGGGGDDYLWGDEGNDTIDGGKGDDAIYSDDGNDSIEGGEGDDTIYAGAGDDDVSGDGGDDDIWDGWGDDDIEGDGGEDDISGGKGDDDLDGGDGGDDLSGGSGDDELIGDSGDDEMDGRAGDDTLAGGLGEDSLSGGAGADQEHGGYDDDQILGQSGRDTIWGGAGSDTLVGGGSRDLVYSQSGDKVKWDRWDKSRNEQLVNPLHKVEDQTALKKWLIDEAVKRYKNLLGTESTRSWRDGSTDDGYYLAYGWCCGILMPYGMVTAYDVTSAQPVSPRSAVTSLDHSDTNTQVQGVDEADLVETDGQYLYSISDGKLFIISALPADETKVISTTSIDGGVSGIYLDGDRLVVLSSVYRNKTVHSQDGLTWDGPYQQQTRVTVLDVSDRATPTVIEESALDGWLTSSREIGGKLYLIMNNGLNPPMPGTIDIGEPTQTQEPYWGWGYVRLVTPGGVTDGTSIDLRAEPATMTVWHQQYRYETEDEFRARLEGMSLDDLLPQYSASVRGADGQMVDSSGSLAGQIYVPDDDSHYTWNMSSVVLINLDDPQPGPTASTNIIGMQGDVYASAENLYVTTRVHETPMGDWEGETRTDIYKFNLGDSSVDLEATGEVPGWVLNSFSMDEAGDQFRIATSSSESSASNNVFVLREQGRDLKIIGGVTGLALAEKIYAARFVGDKAYLVTFPVASRGWDPLFTVDLSDPTQPGVMGELVIPGYSTYLHPIDDTHLLAVGRSGQDVEVSLFDVSDMSAPRRVDVFTVVGGWETWSAAEHDSHAFSYFPEHHILALPVVNFDWRLNNPQQTLMLNVDDEKGFTEVGRIDGPSYWSQQRNVRIGEFVYAFFGTELKVVSLAAPQDVVADVQLNPPMAVNDVSEEVTMVE